MLQACLAIKQHNSAALVPPPPTPHYRGLVTRACTLMRVVCMHSTSPTPFFQITSPPSSFSSFCGGEDTKPLHWWWPRRERGRGCQDRKGPQAHTILKTKARDTQAYKCAWVACGVGAFWGCGASGGGGVDG